MAVGASELPGSKSGDNTSRPPSRNRNATVPTLPRTDNNSKLLNTKKAWGIVTEPSPSTKPAGSQGKTKQTLAKSLSLPDRGGSTPRLGESGPKTGNFFYDREHFLKTGRHRYRLVTDKSSQEFKQVVEDMFVEKHGCPGTVEKKKISRGRWGRAVGMSTAAMGFRNLAKLGANRRAASSSNLLSKSPRESVLMRATSKIFSVPEEVKTDNNNAKFSEQFKKSFYNVAKGSPRSVTDSTDSFTRPRPQRRASVLSIGSRPPSRASEDRVDPATRGWNMLKSSLRDSAAMERANIKTPADLERAKSDLFERYASPSPGKAVE
ncbi:Hypp5991 [Branchiostoma lanceolatum]|uniref:Hypp5991 protein n=1 Tax=Branchiostoma lanceolatum TaxID=7740 RepID=A0A8J9YN94_BRALA|nr:Hypp5991 [Branchiostoma lanceolatum]